MLDAPPESGGAITLTQFVGNMGIMQQKPNHTPSRAFWAVSAIAALAFHISAASAAAPVPSAAALNAEIDAKGAKEVVNRLNRAHPDSNGQNDWSRVTDQMWMGRAAYIKLAPKLAPGTDAGSSEDLGISLAHALPLAPITVLRATDLKDGPTLGVSRVCGVPFIENTVKDIAGYIHAAQLALGKVATPELQAVKAACLTQLAADAKPLPAQQNQ
jgi:hypothetical protein